MGAQQLESTRLVLTPFSENFLTQRYLSWLNNPAVVRLSELRYVQHTFASCKDYYLSFQNSPHYYWAILAKDRDLHHIGNITAYVDTRSNVADIGILIGETNVWGMGYGLEAWQTVCDFLKRIKIRKITAGTLSMNTPMIKIMKHSNMVEDGQRLRHHIIEGKEVDVVFYALFNNP